MLLTLLLSVNQDVLIEVALFFYFGYASLLLFIFQINSQMVYRLLENPRGHIAWTPCKDSPAKKTFDTKDLYVY